MVVKLSDLIPHDENHVEKATLRTQGQQRSRMEAQRPLAPEPPVEINCILDMAVQTDLERAIERVRHTDAERAHVALERSRRINASHIAKKNQWVKSIKSKAYRKRIREQKQERAAEKEKIEIEVEGAAGSGSEEDSTAEQSVPVTPPEKSETVSAEAKAHSILQEVLLPPSDNIKEDPEPVSVHFSFRREEKQTPTPMERMLGLDEEFAQEKEQHEAKDAPKQEEIVLPGWNTWGGASIEPRKNPANTRIRSRKGIETRKRRDFNASHVIYNERASLSKNPKYGVTALPYGHESMEQYRKTLAIPFSKVNQPLKLFRELVKEKDHNMDAEDLEYSYNI